MAGTWRRGLAPIVLAAAALALYANALGNPFIGDDELAVVGNPTVARPSTTGLVALWTMDYWRGVDPDGRPVELASDHNLYRPVTMLTFWLNGRVAGIDAPAFRVVNVLVHALAAWLIGLLCAAWSGPWGGALGAAVVLLHPTATDVVNRIVGRADVLVLAALAGFLVVQHAAARGGWTWRRVVAGAGATAVALGAKESGLALLPLAAVHAWLLRGSSPRPGVARHAWRGALTLGLPLALYLAGRVVAVDAPDYDVPPSWDLGGNPLWGKELATRLPASATLAWSYARLMVWPWPLIAFDVPARLPEWSAPAVWAGLAVLAALVAIAVHGVLGRRPAGLAAVWWLAFYAVVAQLAVPIGAYREVRFAYPMVGALAVALAGLGARAAAGSRSRRAGAAALAVAAGALAAGLVVARNRDFRDLETLLRADIRERPESPAALIRLANVLDLSGRVAEAERTFQRVGELAPRSPQARYELADFYKRRGRADLARQLHEQAVELDPDYYLSLVSLAAMALDAGDLARAAPLLARAAAVAPDDPFVVYNLAVLDEYRGNRARALASLRALVARRPDFGLAVHGLQQLEEAERRAPGRR